MAGNDHQLEKTIGQLLEPSHNPRRHITAPNTRVLDVFDDPFDNLPTQAFGPRPDLLGDSSVTTAQSKSLAETPPS
jgi:hypothetical protein